jgi:Uma2 family endonuclease
MALASMPKTPAQLPNGLPGLEPGDHLDQPTFHERYKAMPEHVRAELIGGVVYMPSPVKAAHGEVHGELVTWLKLYKAATPGTRAFDNSTQILGEDSEPQPDAALIVVGGGTREDAEGFLVGPPELAAEVALSSESYDLHSKKADYERYGIGEYLVVVLRLKRVIWFVREGGVFVEMPPDADGIYRSRAFKGLWLDPAALLAGDTGRLQAVLAQGLASPEHAAFVASLTKG